MKIKILKNCTLLLFWIFTLTNCRYLKEDPATAAKIDVWYGTEQYFGRNGNAQRQINVLGNIQSEFKQIKAYYTLNDSDIKNFLTLGCDLHRLADVGDFNIEIERDQLKFGKNIIHLFVSLNDTILNTRDITIHYRNDRKWPIPCQVKWEEISNMQDVVEIVDGKWELTDSGIRVKHEYYDRILSLGDTSWRNYEVETSVTFHGFTPPAKGPPTYNVSHVAIASRWPGHDIDSLQPNRKWFPLGATSEFRITDNYDSCRWRIFDGENFYNEQPVSDYRSIKPEVVYKMKHRVEDLPGLRTLYSVKIWERNENEPQEWDFQATEISTRREYGSACLIAHHTNVTFGDISVVPVNSPKEE